MRRECPGPQHEPDGAGWYCPPDGKEYDGQDCDQCRLDREDWLELWSERDPQGPPVLAMYPPAFN